ncbi:MAG: lipocalin-like domain-containing protein [Chloroflexi bacterium]|nr:lipocalin-like domain-containing protein [Chloroflexota bacterium]MBK6710401.1 lipocalin-like domain-containing protein [Chloroflexota bacterium]MBK7180110.1 lipocalin-like domain-containing protein [Chloroflexota bacterium]MBK7917676.1 lipocalin-like domain-containing protein [Chloroflexota bacterium]MBK8934738.1 lipocalin-like domain-containing protein [Chloroflexota bacterium]
MNRINPVYLPFVGAWKLVASEFKQADGTSTFPLGAQPQGRIFYSAQGQMAAQLMRPDRPNLRANDVSATAVADLKAAFDGYTAYFGAYTIDTAAAQVTHHVEGSLLPNWIGKDLVRFYEFSADGRVLTLSTPPMGPEDARVVGLLVWERLDE